jgi:type IV pilus assembly protein PilA
MKIMNRKNKKGFTLIELIVVIAILAILAAVAVPNFIGITDKATAAQQNGAAAEYANAINIFNATAASADKITSASKPADLSALNTKLASLAPTLSTDISATAVYNKLVISAAGVATIDKTKS